MILLIDNYDSFVFNLARYFRELGCEVGVVRNDSTSIAEIESLQPEAIVLSPGPCTPNEAGICLASPWALDVTEFLREGANEFEILVTNTLANHLSDTPTPYVLEGQTDAGLFGPVRLTLIVSEVGPEPLLAKVNDLRDESLVGC